MECYATPIGGKYFNIFVAFYFAGLEATVPLALPTQEGGNKGSYFKEGRVKCKQKIFKILPPIEVAYYFLSTQG